MCEENKVTCRVCRQIVDKKDLGIEIYQTCKSCKPLIYRRVKTSLPMWKIKSKTKQVLNRKTSYYVLGTFGMRYAVWVQRFDYSVAILGTYVEYADAVDAYNRLPSAAIETSYQADIKLVLSANSPREAEELIREIIPTLECNVDIINIDITSSISKM